MKKTFAVAVLFVGLVWVANRWWGTGTAESFRLAEQIRIEVPVVATSAFETSHTIVEQPANASVRMGGLQPSQYLDGSGGYRRAVLAPPPSLVRYRVRVPRGSLLQFGVGVEGDGKRDADASGVRFSVEMDGEEIFSRTVNPAGSRHHRRWFDESIPLDTGDLREVEVSFRTERTSGTGAMAGLPGWSRVQVVREERVDREPASADRPNVVILLVDTLRADSLGCYGAAASASPNLDRLATTGVVFSDSTSQSPWTMPSVASLLTGLYPRSHGVVGGSRHWPAPGGMTAQADWASLSGELPTIAGEAQRHGITTFGVSANPIVSRGTNLAHGFETFVELGWRAERNSWASAAGINRVFLRWLRRNKALRFLAYLHYMEPHSPYQPPPEWQPTPAPGVGNRTRKGQASDLARVIRKGGAPLDALNLGHLRQLYDSEIRFWDAQLAALLEGLAELGLRGNTILIITADHGEEFQEHGLLGHGAHLFDESIRVPFVIVGPTLVGPTLEGARSNIPAQGIDLFPTVAGLLGFSPPANLPGQDLLAQARARPVFSETGYGRTDGATDVELVAVRWSNWKLIQAPGLRKSSLFNLRRDSAERTDLFGTEKVAAPLSRFLDEWRASVPPPPAVQAQDPGLHDKLEALGYVD